MFMFMFLRPGRETGEEDDAETRDFDRLLPVILFLRDASFRQPRDRERFEHDARP